MKNPGRLIVVSNRLPITVGFVNDEPRLQKSDGGLVSALRPILRQTGGCWIGWTGTDYDEIPSRLLKSLDQNYCLEPVFLTPSEKVSYYDGFSNEIIWPLFHGLPSRCRFNSAYWNSYCGANDKFAEAVARVSQENDFIWVHDYHLMMVADALRTRGLERRLAYFHHIPFPSPDIFEALPWREKILQALMQFNVIGFQTSKDQGHFVACLRRCLSGVHIARIGETIVARASGQCTMLGTYPISVDYDEFSTHASQPSVIAVAEMIATKVGNTRILLGVDRLDYTKGIPERLIAFQALLERNPALRGRVTMLQFVVPSRENIPEYRELRLRIENLVGKINGEYSSPGWVPIQYFYRSISRDELITFYRAADIALATPLKDGMNLVAKEFCASRPDSRGVLILSHFAGAAEELKCGALLVNPHDTEVFAATIRKALEMPEHQQRIRMVAMRSQIREYDVFHWARSFNVFAAVTSVPLYESSEPSQCIRQVACP